MAINPCPSCGQPIAIEDINIKEGVGLCRACGKLSRLADIADEPAVDAKALATPPAGCSYEEQLGGGLVVRASLRSAGAAVGALVFCLFWNSIVSVFALHAIGGLYTHFAGPLPTWYPMQSSQGEDGRTGHNMPLGETLGLCVFLIPFVLVGAGTALTVLMCLIGRVEIIVLGTEGRVRTGFGLFNWTRRFDASKVTRISIGQTKYEQNSQRKPLILIEADRTVKFGSMLPDERRAWMAGMLHVLLVARTKEGRTAKLGLSPVARG